MSTRELVPNTPTSTAPQQQQQQQLEQSQQVDSVGQSYLWSALARQPQLGAGDATAGGDKEEHSGDELLDASHYADGAHAAGEGVADQLLTVQDSQASPQDGEDGVDELDNTEHSHSQPQNGPQDDFRLSQLAQDEPKSLGRTQHEQETFKRHPRQDKRLSEGGSTADQSSSGEVDNSRAPSASAAVSMDLTKAEGRVLHAQPPPTAKPLSPRFAPTDTTGLLEETILPTQIEQDDAEAEQGAPRQSDSQKENASPARSPTRPSSASAERATLALGVRNSHINIEEQNGPSSSPAIERELLGSARLSTTSKRPPPTTFQTGPGASASALEPASSADPDISPSVLLLSPHKAALQSAALGSSGAPIQMSSAGPSGELMDSDGPITSTPAFLNAQPPDPSMTAARTVPNLAAAHTDRPIRLSRNATEPVGVTPFATSSAMKAAPPSKQKKRREPWDDLSQDSGASLGKSQNSAMKPTQAAESGAAAENGDRLDDQVNAAERKEDPGSEGGRSAPDGSDDEVRDVVATVVHEDAMNFEESIAATVPHEESVTTRSANATPSARQVGKLSQPEDEDQFSSLESGGPKRRTGQPALFAPESATSSPSQVSFSLAPIEFPTASAPEQTKDKKRLSDISELRSSSEVPPTQYEVPATQKEYDIFRSSDKSQEPAFDNSDRWHASFQVPDKAEASQRKSPPPPVQPAPGRALKRQPPPPSPIRNGAFAAGPAAGEKATEHPQAGDADESMCLLGQAMDASTLAQATQRMQPVSESSPEVPLAKKARRVGPSKASVSFAAGVIPDSDGPTSSEPIAGPSRITAGPSEDLGDELSPLGSPRRQESPAPATKAPAKGMAKPTTKGKGKSARGRRLLVSTESRDVLDLLADTKPEDAAAAEQEETNYDDVPTTRNAKGRSRRTSGGADRPSPPPKSGPKSKTVDKGKRRADEPPVGHEHGEGDAASPRKKKKQKLSVPTADDFELDIVVGPASSRLSTPAQSSPPNQTNRAAAARPPTTTTKTAAAKKKGKVKAEPKRRSTTGSARAVASSAAAAAAEDAPLAGPSRRRSAPADGSVREASVVDEKPRVRRLPESAPFRRVFGLWRDDHCFYPGEIEWASSGTVFVRFDDTNTGKLRPSEIRYCRLDKGDRVLYLGRDVDGPADIRQQLIVVDVEQTARRDAEELDGLGDDHLQPDDLVTVRSPDGREYRVPLKTLFIPGNRAPQLEKSRPTSSELTALEESKAKDGETESNETESRNVEAKLAPAPKKFSLPAFEGTRTATSIFSRTAFIVTKADRLKEGRATLDLAPYGAVMIDWPHLFRVRAAAADLKAPPQVEFQMEDFADIDEIFLLSDKHCSTPKYLAALALGIPCLSPDFATQSIKENIRLPWQQFVLPAGHLRCLDAVAIGSMYRAMTKSSFDLGSLERAYRDGGVFADCSFLVVCKPYLKAKPDAKEKEAAQRHHYQIYALLACASARLVHFTASLADAKSASGYDLVLLVEDQDTIPPLPALLRSHKGLVTVTWVKQCLVAGRLLPPARLKEVAAATEAE